MERVTHGGVKESWAVGDSLCPSDLVIGHSTRSGLVSGRIDFSVAFIALQRPAQVLRSGYHSPTRWLRPFTRSRAISLQIMPAEAMPSVKSHSELDQEASGYHMSLGEETAPALSTCSLAFEHT